MSVLGGQGSEKGRQQPGGPSCRNQGVAGEPEDGRSQPSDTEKGGRACPSAGRRELRKACPREGEAGSLGGRGPGPVPSKMLAIWPFALRAEWESWADFAPQTQTSSTTVFAVHWQRPANPNFFQLSPLASCLKGQASFCLLPGTGEGLTAPWTLTAPLPSAAG